MRCPEESSTESPTKIDPPRKVGFEFKKKKVESVEAGTNGVGRMREVQRELSLSDF